MTDESIACKIVSKNYNNYFSAKTHISLADYKAFQLNVETELASNMVTISNKTMLLIFAHLCSEKQKTFDKQIEDTIKTNNMENRFSIDNFNVLSMTLIAFNQRLQRCEEQLDKLLKEPNPICVQCNLNNNKSINCSTLDLCFDENELEKLDDDLNLFVGL